MSASPHHHTCSPLARRSIRPILLPAIAGAAIASATLHAQQGLDAIRPANPGAAVADAPPASPVESAALQHDLALLQRLETVLPKPLALDGKPAGEVMKLIRELVKSPIELDRGALGDSGGWELASVSCEAVSVRALLDAMLEAISPEYERYVVDVAAGMLVLTDGSGRSRLGSSATYPLADLLARFGASTTEERSLEQLRNALTDGIQQTVAPEDWFDNGGNLATIVWTGSVATIVAPPSIHHELRKYLARLEAALPEANLQWAITVAEMGNNIDASARDAAVASRLAFDKLVKDGTARVLSAPRLLAPANEAAEVQIGTDRSALTVRIEPAASDGARVYTVRVSESADGRPVRSMLLRAVPGTRAAGMVEVDGKALYVEARTISEIDRKLKKDR